MTQPPLFKIRDAVLLRSTKELGRIAREPILDGGEYWYKVQFSKRLENVVEELLEPLHEADETLESLAARGQWGTIQAFRCALAVERIGSASQNTIYAYRAQRILFEAFQYKPLLKMLDSPDRRLLIADEVGLGKTIETGLILAELEARKPLERVLILCPSRLREKWHDEMSRKFGQEFDIFNRADLLDYLKRIQRNPGRSRLRAVVSVQTFRDPDVREEFLAHVGSLDMVIVDEAHHARNPSALTSDMLRDVCGMADAALLLTATPLHLGNRDLFTLVQALRPTVFRNEIAFDQQLQRYQGIYEVALMVRSRRADQLVAARQILIDLFETDIVLKNRDPLAMRVISDMEKVPDDWRYWVDLERRIQELHPLATILTRTRKSDVHERVAVRDAHVWRCQWTPEEDEAYRKLINGSGQLGWIDAPLSLGQIQRARQAASCLPAALGTSEAAESDDEAVELTDILPSDVLTTLPRDPGPASLPTLKGRDSKFERLLELLGFIDNEEPGAKVLIFTFFRGTSQYLQDRLLARDYRSLRIAGDVRSDPKNPDRDDRGRLLRQFREDPEARIMVSTEVGSEGLDFQFCHFLVNYDLPWNPMVIEQRIGRIDRFGQQADKLRIFNLVVEGTVEDKILARLYERILKFRASLGQLEAIVGDEIRELQKDYVSGNLTPQQAEERVARMERAILQRRASIEELEQNAGKLFGHEDYIKEQLRQVGRLGRYVSEKAMLAVIETFLKTQHPDVRMWEEPEGIHNLRPTHELNRDIQACATPENPWIDRSRRGVYSFCFDGQVAYKHPEFDLINVSHPLLKAALEPVKRQLLNAHAKAGRGRIVLAGEDDLELQAGTYFLAVFTHRIDGIRGRAVLEAIGWSSEGSQILPTEVGERLLHLVQDQGQEWDGHEPSPALPPELWARIESEARRRNQMLRESERRENEALYLRRAGLLDAEYQHDKSVKATRLKTATERMRSGHVLAALQAQIDKAEVTFKTRREELERLRETRCTLSDAVAVCLVKVVRR